MTRSQYEHGLMGGYPMYGMGISEVDRLTQALQAGLQTVVGNISKPPTAPAVRSPSRPKTNYMPFLAIGAGILILFFVMRRK